VKALGSSDDQFREMFFEEARELLIGLEEGLMDLERRQGDRAHLDKTFRAAHSLKGAAAMLGMEAIAKFTHGIEAVLEKIRAGALAVDSDIITTLLESRDHLAAMVEGEAAGSPVPGSGDLSFRLGELLRGVVRPPPAPPAPATPPPPAAPAAPAVPSASAPSSPAGIVSPPVKEETLGAAPTTAPVPPIKKKVRPSRSRKDEQRQPGAKPRRRKSRSMEQAEQASTSSAHGSPSGPDLPSDSERTTYQITLSPGPGMLRRGVNPLGVLDELSELGPCQVSTDPQQVPLLDELDPERCYLNWTISLQTDSSPERLKEVFLLVFEDSSVRVEQRLPDGSLVPLLWESPVSPAVQLPEPGEISAVRPSPGLEGITSAIASAAGTTGSAVNGAAPSPAAAASGAASPPRPGAQSGAISPFPGARPHARIRVDALQLDDLVGLAGELVVLSDNLQGLREEPRVASWLHALESLERVSREIRDTTLELRMVPVDELFSRFPRVVRDLADRSGKEIELRIIGQETRLDRTIVERLGDPMVHLIRNAVDHALETPTERLEKGKPRVGRITLVAGHEGDRVAIRVEDDGRGLDREKIVRKAAAQGMIAPGTSPDDPRVVSLIFEPGFSTREDVSELSGRGVGLDVVRDSVRALRGSLSVESTPGKGTAFIFRLPLTLALIDGLLVETAGGVFVVPLAQVEECVSLNGTGPALARQRPCVSVRGELIPTISLRQLFRTNGPLPARQELLLTRHAGQRIGIAVDRLVGRVQAVIQSLGEGLHGLTRFSGATILGDGSVSLILDLSAVVSESLVADQGTYATPSIGVRAENSR
jgi:two-component system chemotaxis sensor kinase CheA